MKSLQVKEIVKLSIDKIAINPENPRHDAVLNLGESFVMKQLLKTKKDIQAMYKLICDIYSEGWFPQSIVTVTYDSKTGKYVAWDGNRRLTALKILQNPEITSYFNFTYTQIRNIFRMHKEINDKGFYEVSCYIADSFEDCANYIRTIHTTDTGALPWSDLAKKRFEYKLGKKNMFSQLKDYCSKTFENISDNFPVNKFEKIVSSRVGKEFLQIDNTDNILTSTGQIKELERKLTKIVNDIENGKIKSKDIKNSENIRRYLYNENVEDVIEEKNKKMDVIPKQISLLEDNRKLDSEPKERIEEKQNEFRFKMIRKDNQIMFKNINCEKLKYNNERAKGIRDLCYEIQHLSFNNLYKSFPIAYCFLIRSLLEQTSIYFLINKGKWNKLKSANNGKDLRLERIIKEISKNKTNLILDDTISRAWETCFNNEGMKNYLDLVIHHPYKIKANVDSIRTITDMGIFAIIQYFINS